MAKLISSAEHDIAQGIHLNFKARVAAHPDAIALTFNKASVSYAELDAQSDNIAHKLIELGVRFEECVGVMAGRTPAMIAAILGVLKAGACYVPLEPSLPIARKLLIAKETGMQVVLAENKELASELSTNSLQIHGLSDLLDSRSKSTTYLPEVSAETLAYIMFTSGTTGRPKGVMIEHRHVMNLVSTADYAQSESIPRLLLLGTIGFDATTFEIWWTLLSGGTLVMVSDEVRINPVALKKTIEELAISTLLLTTGFCNQLIADTPDIFRSLECLIIGGDVLSSATVKAIRKTSTKLKLVNAYGPTENTVFTTAWVCHSNKSTPKDAGNDINIESVPIGKPLIPCSVTVVDDNLQPLPDGEVGELLIGGDQVARGYLTQEKVDHDKRRQDDLTQELTQEPFLTLPGLGRVYRSGDFGYLRSDGALMFVSRKDQQLKINGYRIEPGEIESALRSLTTITQAIVCPSLDNNRKVIVAYVVVSDSNTPNKQNDAEFPKPNKSSLEESIKKELAKTLPEFMLPAKIVIVDNFTLDANGKVDRKALPDAFPKSTTVSSAASNASTNTSNTPGKNPSKNSVASFNLKQTEAFIQAVYAKSLRVEVGLDDDFFKLGGNSINSLRIFSGLHGLPIKLSDIMHYRTVRNLANHAYSVRTSELDTEGQKAIDAQSFQTKTQYLRCLVGNAASHKELIVAPSDTESNADTDEINQEPAAHYSTPMHFTSKVTELIKPAEFRRRLNLKGPDELDLELLKTTIRNDYQENNHRIRQWTKAKRIPFSPIQALQAKFSVSMSLGVFEIVPLQGIKTLQHAVTQTITKHQLLRSLPEKAEAERRHFQSYNPNAKQPLQASVIDLCNYYFNDEQFFQVAHELVTDLQCTESDLMYHFVIIRRNLRDHFIVSIMHHSLFDRVSDELLQRDFRRFCQGEIGAQPDEQPNDKKPTFSDYISVLYSGPQNISDAELIRECRLDDYHAYKTHALATESLIPSQTAHNFEIAVPLPPHIVNDFPIGAAAAIYTHAICTTYQWSGIPLLFIYEARRYLDNDYYDVLGELIDYVPIALHAEISLPETQSRILNQLKLATDHNVNFLKLMLEDSENTDNSDNKAHKDNANDIPTSTTLLDHGHELEHIDFTMFNFLSNAESGISYKDHYSDKIESGPHPLPIQSFLNCIVVCYEDGLIYKIRGSYQTDIQALRTAFQTAAEFLVSNAGAVEAPMGTD